MFFRDFSSCFYDSVCLNCHGLHKFVQNLMSQQNVIWIHALIEKFRDVEGLTFCAMQLTWS